MEKNAFIRIFTAKKSGARCCALVVKYGEGYEKLFFDTPFTFMRLLDIKPTEFYELPNGDYEIK